jgi:hypothetical protein
MTQLTPTAADRLAEGLAGVCRASGIALREPTLIKFTMNAVYRVGDFVVRLSEGADARTRSHRLISYVRALSTVGAPIVSLADDIPQPVTFGPWTATIWLWLTPRSAAAHAIDLAEPLRAFHDTAADLRTQASPADGDSGLGLVGANDWQPIAKSQRRIENTRELPPHHAEWSESWARRETGENLTTVLDWLETWAHDLAGQLHRAEWSLPAGLIHGDAHTGNLLLTTDSHALLCDLDSVCHGPREWDLVPTAHGAARFGRSKDDYLAFASAYGLDITQTEHWPLLRGIRELQLVTSVLPRLAGRPAVADQLGHRLRSLQQQDPSAIWTRYA